ncbi:MAG: P1 family peptidase [Tissierellia bacterium]|nr:P1 family peptidase [Tissierellia bacterium]
MYKGKLTDVQGIKLGHYQDYKAMTGCSVAIVEDGAICGVDVRGSAPGTRETDLLKPENYVQKVHGILLSGGSAYGLNAATGVMKYLEEKNIGLDVDVCKVPIVVAAVIFDLNIGDHRIRPDEKMGYLASANASYDDNSQGIVGAGTGASVGKILGNDFSMNSGIGQASIKVGDIIVSSITVLNAFGDIYDYEKQKQIAGVYDKDRKEFLNTNKIYEKNIKEFNAFNKPTNTTISLVATNAKLDKAQAKKISQMAHDGYARSINPVHTMFDGDTIFTISTGDKKADISFVGSMAAKVISRSIANAIYKSKN